ncbi:hypothetical protein A3J98_02900 [candidate division WS6 bacterium RIFOXYC1_FULL_33_10]|uniref:N-formylglutamate amidohydrolase n=1 Tax=candidate division WS6 bacterium RIFOXYC1_FULL_33_10 TaxID=1802606 RepID=A0A1F4UQ03_9BACT|nr:MAG: hypothetical protein A3J98_02900 [candidate division WS6 bacterium RIFOXYC1_FULL_33_10]
MKRNEYVEIIEGRIPVLLSAPHVYPHRRPSLTLSYKGGEEFTDMIVREICGNTGAWGIIQAKETPFDPNYHKIMDNPYKEAVAQIIKIGNITKFLDIHGLNLSNEYDLGIYYPSKYFKSINLSKDISNAVDKGKLRGINSCIFRLNDDLEETLGEYVASELKVPSVQLEVARYIRESDKLRNAFIGNLSEYVLL